MLMSSYLVEAAADLMGVAIEALYGRFLGSSRPL
jgi:hypothetical protein